MIAQDAKSAEIIRPILRGKDIKRYSYEFADKYLITTYNAYTDSEGNYIPSVDINDYPAVKVHLDNYSEQISKRQDKGDTPYNLRRCAYMDDFNKPKIMYSEIVQSPQFYLDNDSEFVSEASGFLLTGEDLEYLIDWLNSMTIAWVFKNFYAGGSLGEHGFRYKKVFLENLPIPKKHDSTNYKDNEILIQERLELTTEEIKFISSVVNP